MILSSESRASSRRIIDICKEKLSLWADLKFIIMLRIAFEGGYENLNYVFLIQWIVAVLISWYDLGIGCLPSDVQELSIMAHRCDCGWISFAVDISEGEDYLIFIRAQRDQNRDTYLQCCKESQIFYHKAIKDEWSKIFLKNMSKYFMKFISILKIVLHTPKFIENYPKWIMQYFIKL